MPPLSPYQNLKRQHDMAKNQLTLPIYSNSSCPRAHPSMHMQCKAMSHVDANCTGQLSNYFEQLSRRVIGITYQLICITQPSATNNTSVRHIEIKYKLLKFMLRFFKRQFSTRTIYNCVLCRCRRSG
jgi:hypothetical protein